METNKKLKQKQGISLLVLIISIIVIIIIAAVVILSVLQTDTFGKADESTFKSNMNVFLDEYNMFLSTKKAETKDQFEPEALTANASSVTYIGDGAIQELDTIFDIIPSLEKSKYKNAFQISNGKFTYIWSELNDEETQWVKEVLDNRIDLNE